MKHPYSEVVKSFTEQTDNCKIYISLSKDGWVEADNKPIITDYNITFSISSDQIKDLINLLQKENETN